jgi:hypothetical protein
MISVPPGFGCPCPDADPTTMAQIASARSATSEDVRRPGRAGMAEPPL